MTLRDFTRRAVGVPFRAHGRTYDGWDCYGLVQQAFREVLQITLPDWSKEYDDINDWPRIAELFQGAKTICERVDPPKPGDVAMIYRRGRATHCGLVLAGRRILHVEEKAGTIIEPIARNRFRVEGYYRLKDSER